MFARHLHFLRDQFAHVLALEAGFDKRRAGPPDKGVGHREGQG